VRSRLDPAAADFPLQLNGKQKEPARDYFASFCRMRQVGLGFLVGQATADPFHF
jgi:hypothetical protein